jgi:diguanylate cyclase (GGDEF)-like protein/PAS domain S-box-containing protein
MSQTRDNNVVAIEADKNLFVQSEQIQIIYSNAIPSSIGIIVITVAVWLGLFNTIDTFLLSGWSAWMLSVAISRLVLYRQFTSSYTPENTPAWASKFLINTTIAGVGWSMLCLLFITLNDPTYQTAIVLIILGVLGATAPVLSSYLPAFISSSLPSVVVLPVAIYTQLNETGPLLASALILFIALVYHIGIKTNKHLESIFRLEYENKNLVNTLYGEVENRKKIQALLEQHQQRLEEIVDERTKQLKDSNQELTNEIGRRKHAQDALKRNERFLNAIIHTVPDLIWLKDPDGVYLACNTRFEDFFGASEAEILGKTDYDFVDTELADLFRAHDKMAMLKSSPSVNEEWITFANDGHRELLETTKTSMLDGNGKLIGVLGVGHNITERKKAEAFDEKSAEILEMIALGRTASEIYNAIALMYEERHPGMRCSLLELDGDTLLHGGAPSLPKEYCEAVHGLKIGPDVGSCGTSTFTGKRCLVENIETDPKWAKIKQAALSHGVRCCWSEPIINSSGEVLGAFGMYYDHPALPNAEESNDLLSAARLASIVMERDQAQKRIQELAYVDELTGLASRSRFYQSIEELIKISARHNRRFSLLYIDLDDFKDINDSLGHDTGDLLLKKIAKRLESASRESDFIGRLGGDEFCILVDDVVDNYDAAHVAQRCLETISQPIELSSRKLTPGCSIGIAHFPEDGENLSTLLKAADTSLYAAKEHGKHCYAFYKPELTRMAEYRFQVEQYLREAIEKQQLSLVYQPQVSITTGIITGVEALSRWRHPQLGQVPPTEFIAIAERIGMIKPLTEWVLNTACSQATEWKKAGFSNLHMSVNISPSHFLDKDIVSLIKSVIDKTGIAPGKLQLEVTEGVVQTDQENLSAFQDLKDLGVLLALDDFGTGYSSFASLKHLNVDCLKIDKYFVDGMLSDQKNLALISSMIEMGHNLGHKIIAEGVETSEQLDIIKKLGCETAQGYLFSKPVENDEIAHLLNSNFIVSRDIEPAFIPR